MGARFSYLEHSGFLCIAHRGGALEAPENTMAAFENAVRSGCTYIETDAYATRDGYLLAFHDDRLDRVTDRQGMIEETDLATVRTARIDHNHQIPLLEELLIAFPKAKVNIDAKHDKAVEPLIDLIKRLGAEDRVCLGAFSDSRVQKMRAAFGGRICTSLPPAEVTRLYMAKFRLPVRAISGACAQVPERHGRIRLVDRAFLKAAHRRNIPVHVWTVNEPADMERLIDLGVDGLVTDRPSLLRDILKKRGITAS